MTVSVKDERGQEIQREILAPGHGNRVAIVTNAGGPGIVATDMTVSSGLRLARFQEETVEALDSHLPATANLNNPVDIIGDAPTDRYENALAAYGQTGQMKEEDWLTPDPIDQRQLHYGYCGSKRYLYRPIHQHPHFLVLDL